MDTENATTKSGTLRLFALAASLALSLTLAACGGGGSGGGGGGGVDHGVRVTPGSLSLEIGESQLLDAVVAGGAGSQDVDWSSSDVAVATVDATGLVLAVGAGDAVITAVSQADSSLSGTAEVDVTAPSCRAPVEIEADIIAETTLGRLDHALGCTDYYVKFMRQVRKPLSIEAGVTIDFDMGAGFFVTVLDGSLTATGTESEPVTFRRASGAVLPWTGLVFGTASPANRLEHVVIEGTGAPITDAVAPLTLQASVIVPIGYRVSIVDTDFRGGEGNGVWLAEGAVLPEFTGNSFSGHGLAPIALDISQLQYLGTGNTFRGPAESPNAAEVIELIARQLEVDATIPKLELPYRLTGDFDANRSYTVHGSVLTIEPGARLLFGAGAGITVRDRGPANPGAILAIGTADEPIVMTADVAEAGPDHWDGVAISSTGSSRVQHAEIGFGGGRTGMSIPDNSGANIIVSGNAVLDVSDSHLHDAPLCLERIPGGTLLLTGSNNTTAGCSDVDMP